MARLTCPRISSQALTTQPLYYFHYSPEKENRSNSNHRQIPYTLMYLPRVVRLDLERTLRQKRKTILAFHQFFSKPKKRHKMCFPYLVSKHLALLSNYKTYSRHRVFRPTASYEKNND